MNKLFTLLSIAYGSVFISACSSQDENNSNILEDPVSTLNWQSCSDQSVLQCTTLDVFLDPTDTESDTISLALNRLPSIQDEREGIVLINPGGPGGSGIELLDELSSSNALPEALREKFDFIGFDPRGVGGSAAVDCSEFGSTEVNKYLGNEQAIEQFVEKQMAVAASCDKKYGVYLQQLGSQNVVHDMDAIRHAAGEEKIHYLGYSYGTRLGALYLQTYPENSGHFILDASVKPEPEVELLITGGIEAMQASLVMMLEECSSINSDCSGNRLMEQLVSRISLLANENREDELEILASLVFFAVQEQEVAPLLLLPLYEYLQSDDFAELQAIYNGGVGEFLDDGDDTTERAVMCADDAARPTASDLKILLSDYNQRSDFFAEMVVSQAGMCAGWPASQHALSRITTGQAPPALVIGGTADVLTLASWSEEMAQSIGGYYLESNHLGHTSVFNEQSSCVDAIAEEFLLTGLQPVESVCLLE